MILYDIFTKCIRNLVMFVLYTRIYRFTEGKRVFIHKTIHAER